MAGNLLALAGGTAAWVVALFQGQSPLVLQNVENVDARGRLAPLLSPQAAVWLPGTEGYAIATDRWTPRKNPSFDVVVDVVSEEDVAHTVRYANAHGMPFVAISGKHGYSNYLGRVKHGVGINLRKLNGVEVAKDGTSATIGGGIVTKQLVDALWEKGKMSTTGCCECTGAVAPMLGGGHGWLQGHSLTALLVTFRQYGLMADNLLSARLVLANGSAITVSNSEHPELFWALKGAGHNFGIVTSFSYKIYDRTKENENWAVDTLIFTGDKLEEVFEQTNKLFVDRPVELTWFSMFMPMPDVDAEKPIIIFMIIWQGTSTPSQYTKPFANLDPIVHTNTKTDLVGLAARTGFSNSSPSCQHGNNYLAFPVGTVSNPIQGLRQAFEIQALLPPSLNASWMIVEGYSMAAVQAVDWDGTAFPERGNNLLISPFMMYKPTGDAGEDERLDGEAKKYGMRMREAIAAGQEVNAYVNYAVGDEKVEEVYGHESWRVEKLRRLKMEFDPEGRFGFYNPIA